MSFSPTDYIVKGTIQISLLIHYQKILKKDETIEGEHFDYLCIIFNQNQRGLSFHV